MIGWLRFVFGTAPWWGLVLGAVLAGLEGAVAGFIVGVVLCALMLTQWLAQS